MISGTKAIGELSKLDQDVVLGPSFPFLPPMSIMNCTQPLRVLNLGRVAYT